MQREALLKCDAAVRMRAVVASGAVLVVLAMFMLATGVILVTMIAPLHGVGQGDHRVLMMNLPIPGGAEIGLRLAGEKGQEE